MTDAGTPYGWKAQNPLGFTSLLTGARPGDGFTEVVELTTQADYDAAQSAMYAAPQPAVAPTTISRRQFYQQLAIQGVITNDEALAALRTGTTPAALADLIAALPADQQFGAEMMVLGAEFNRTDPLTLALGASKGWASDQIDALWVAAGLL